MNPDINYQEKILNKSEKRKHYLGLRKKKSLSIVKKYSLQIYKNFEPLLQKKIKTLMTYYAINNEAETSIINEYCIKNNIKLCAPVLNRDYTIDAYYIKKGFPENKNFLHIPEPVSSDEMKTEPGEIDIIIVPGIVFSRNMYRIGYGKGCYDKYLSLLDKRCIKVGLAFSFQVVDTIEPEKFDKPLDYIVTEKEIIKSNRDIN